MALAFFLGELLIFKTLSIRGAISPMIVACKYGTLRNATEAVRQARRAAVPHWAATAGRLRRSGGGSVMDRTKWPGVRHAGVRVGRGVGVALSIRPYKQHEAGWGGDQSQLFEGVHARTC